MPDPAAVLGDLAVLVSAPVMPGNGSAVRAAVSRAGLYVEAHPPVDPVLVVEGALTAAVATTRQFLALA